MDERFFDLITEIAERLDNDWTVDEMAAKTGLSLSQFRLVFNTVTLLTPAAYLKDTRLHRAKHLIKTTYEHINQIGIQVGMRDHSHFTRDFKQKFGVTLRWSNKTGQKTLYNGEYEKIRRRVQEGSNW